MAAPIERMNEPTVSTVSTVEAEDQPTTNNDVPPPGVDVTQTKQWVSVANPGLLDLGTAVTHNNLDVLASLLLSMEKIGIDQAKQIRKAQDQLQTILDILEQDDETSRPSSISSSRRCSVGSRRSSTGRPAPAGDGAEALTEEDQRARAFDEIIENLSVLDDFFDRFILGSCHTPLVKRSENIQASSAAFLEAAKNQLGGYLGETDAQAITAQLSSLDDGQIIEVYIGLSHRNRSKKS